MEGSIVVAVPTNKVRPESWSCGKLWLILEFQWFHVQIAIGLSVILPGGVGVGCIGGRISQPCWPIFMKSKPKRLKRLNLFARCVILLSKHSSNFKFHELFLPSIALLLDQFGSRQLTIALLANYSASKICLRDAMHSQFA